MYHDCFLNIIITHMRNLCAGLAVWAASILLAQWVVRMARQSPAEWANKVVLELGAGCGLPGLAAGTHCCCHWPQPQLTRISYA